MTGWVRRSAAMFPVVNCYEWLWHGYSCTTSPAPGIGAVCVALQRPGLVSLQWEG